ncbi:hypothetical protein [Fontibacter flavus]|uniref:Uncharacterized protein n=1 Tax=Fontibacter flavus TaxID=654838 RepID=A0ABV6FU29_9BACT
MNNIKLKISFLSIFCFIVFEGNSQNLFFIGEKSYPSSENFNLVSQTEGQLYIEKKVNGFFAKDGEDGFLILSPENESQMMIKGKIIIYLEDGTIINCLDRGIYDRVNQKSTTVYRLNNLELQKLKKSDIHSIRYTLKCTNCTFSSDEGDYIGRNILKSSFLFNYHNSQNSNQTKSTKYSTINLVNTLFN